MQHYSFYIWIVPFLIPIAGFLLTRIPFLKKTRLVIDVLLFFAAFMLDLQNVTFRSVTASIFFGFIVMIIIMKISWSALKMKVKLFRYIILAAGFVIFIAKYGEWMVNSSEAVHSWYYPVTVQTHNKSDREFEIKEFKMVREQKIRRIFKFEGTHKSSMFITRLDSFLVPEGYVNSPFVYRWYVNQVGGMTASLIGDKDTLWTLKEIR
jgi:FlaA1/EpsC-like NDP-sugar epimerase